VAVTGKKEFQQFDILTAADTNTYLVNDPRPNYVINGGMDIWQRGVGPVGGAGSVTTGFLADRWQCYRSAYVANSGIQQVSSIGLPGFQYALRYTRNAGDTLTNSMFIGQSIETRNSIQMANNTVTLSLYVRKGATFSASGGLISAYFVSGTGTDQNISSGFTGSVVVAGTDIATTTTWTRYTVTGTLPSNSTQVAVVFAWSPTGRAGATDYIEITGVQLEVGSGASPFRRAGGTIQGELAACQRYYWQFAPGEAFTFGTAWSTTAATFIGKLPVTMRTSSTGSFSGTLTANEPGFGTRTFPTPTVNGGINTYSIDGSGSSGLTIGKPLVQNGGTCFFNSEL
jgi:hypothetical protein